MPDDISLENVALEAAILKATYAVLQEMREADSHLPHKFLEEQLRPRLRQAFLEIMRKEAKRCEAYKTLGSPRVIQIEAALNEVDFIVANLDAQKRKP